MARVRRTAPVIVCLAVLLAACGKSTFRPHASEKEVADFVFKRTGFRPTDVLCPSGIPARVGATYDCHFTGPDGPYTAHVRTTSIHGQRTTESIVTRPSLRPHASEQTVADFVFKRTGFRPTDVRCPSGIPAEVGATYDCHFTGPEGPYTAHVRITSVHGQRTTDYIVTRRSGN